MHQVWHTRKYGTSAEQGSNVQGRNAIVSIVTDTTTWRSSRPRETMFNSFVEEDVFKIAPSWHSPPREKRPTLSWGMTFSCTQRHLTLRARVTLVTTKEFAKEDAKSPRRREHQGLPILTFTTALESKQIDTCLRASVGMPKLFGFILSRKSL